MERYPFSESVAPDMKDGIYFYHYTQDKGIQTDGEPLERDTVDIITVDTGSRGTIRNILEATATSAPSSPCPSGWGLIVIIVLFAYRGRNGGYPFVPKWGNDIDSSGCQYDRLDHSIGILS